MDMWCREVAGSASEVHAIWRADVQLLFKTPALPSGFPRVKVLSPSASPNEALAGIEEINAHYKSHCARARQIAEAYFGSDDVLNRLLIAAYSKPSKPKQA